jgi:hypothetical protein
MKFQGSKGTPCAFYEPEKDLLTVVYGDDFVMVGLDDDLTWLETEMGKHLSMTRKALIGHEETDDKTGTILNRIISFEIGGFVWEADPRHAERIVL